MKKRILERNSFPREAEYLYRCGLDLVNRKKDVEAANVLRQAVYLSPDFVRACLELGDCMNRLGRHREAWEYYIRVLRLDPSRSDCIAGKIFSCRNPPESDGFLAIPLF